MPSSGSRCEHEARVTLSAVADVVASEAIVLAVRELVVLLAVVGFFVWVGYRMMRETRR